MTDLAAEFGRACEKLQVDAGSQQISEKILDRCSILSSETLSTSQKEDAKRLNFACVLFLGSRLRIKETSGQPNGVGLREILESFDISIADFLQELPVVVKTAMPTLSMMFGEDVERQLGVRELQTAFVHSLLLAKKARDLFQKYCNLPLAAGDKPAPILKLTWLLFILAKAELLGPLPDLVTSFNLLVCVVNTIVCHLPRALGAVNFLDTAIFPVRTDTGAPDTLASIAVVGKTSLEAAKPLAESLDLLLQELLGGVIPADPGFAFPDGRSEANRMGFPGLMGDPGTETALSVLDARYEKVYRNAGEIDERSFIERREAEAAASAFASSGATPAISKVQVSTPVRSSSLAAGTPVRLLSPLRPANHSLKTPSPVRMAATSYFATPGPPGTPLSESMQLAAWMRDMSAKSSAQPSEALHGYFKACGEAVTPGILKRAQELSNAIFPLPQAASGVAFLQSTMARERRLEGIKLYYRVLESMLEAEAKRSGTAHFGTLLRNDTFHRCLLACSFEMVIASYRIATLTFPAVLERLQLDAFDLCKLIETFVRHIPGLPRDLKRHLFSIEEKMLESLAWARGSSLYLKLAAACAEPRAEPATDAEQPGSPPASPASSSPSAKRPLDGSPPVSPPKMRKGSAQQRVPLAEEGASPQPPDSPAGTRGGLLSPRRHSATSAFSSFMSPLRPGPAAEFPGALPTAFGPPGEHLQRQGRAVVADFLRKVLKLGLLRLADLCDRMDFDPLDRQDVLTQVYTMVQHVLYEHTHLLYNRHLDQVLLSALYGVCKVNSLKQISFKEIIQHYKKQPQAKTDIFRTVAITQTGPDLFVAKTGDIIEFYNAVFIATVKPFVLQLGSRKAQLVKPPPLAVGGARRTLMSPAAAGKAGYSTPPPGERRGASPVGGQVFVSPLRQSPKQPFLMPRPRMLYAGRMGESAHAYQSPSKDLKYINSRIAAHSQQPPIAPAPPPEVDAARPAAAGPASSDHSCSSGRSSADASHSNSRLSEPVSSQGRLGRQGSGRSPGGASAGDRAGISALAAMARTGRAAPGGSRLDDLHTAALLLGHGEESAPLNGLANGHATRRSRRQAGRAPRET